MCKLIKHLTVREHNLLRVNVRDAFFVWLYDEVDDLAHKLETCVVQGYIREPKMKPQQSF